MSILSIIMINFVSTLASTLFGVALTTPRHQVVRKAKWREDTMRRLPSLFYYIL